MSLETINGNRISGVQMGAAVFGGDNPQPTEVTQINQTVDIEVTNVKPFLKWTGGKSNLLPEIKKLYPFSQGKITKYAEPFVGGGAVLFDILNNYDLESVYIGDINAELINTYHVIRDNVDGLIDALSRMQCEINLIDYINRGNYYYNKRYRFNKLKTEGGNNISIEKAALMIFLNRTCFNGLYRVNSNGFFNVAMGSYKYPTICDEENLMAVSEKLKGVKIICGDYKKSEDFIDEHTFAYFDPPYRPLSGTSHFTSYNAESFDDDKQIELAQFVDCMSSKGALVAISNSDPKNVNINDNFFDDLYSKYNISRVKAPRMINCKVNGRGEINELLISNF